MQENVSGYVVFSWDFVNVKKQLHHQCTFIDRTCSPPVHAHYPYMCTTGVCSPSSICSSPVHVHHQHKSTTSTCSPPVHAYHQCLFIISSSPVHVHHQHMSTTSARSPPVHVNHQYIFTTSTCSLAGIGLKGQQGEWRTGVKNGA